MDSVLAATEKHSNIADRISNIYDNLSLDERKALYLLFKDNKKPLETLQKTERIIFKKPPPTPEEFLDPDNKWLPKIIIEKIPEIVKEDFYHVASKESKYFRICPYGATRVGKSLLSRLLIVYTIIYIHHLREPSLYYGLLPIDKLAIYLLSFVKGKANQLLLEPVFELLESSERFEQVKFIDQVKIRQEEEDESGSYKIIYSKAAKGQDSHITLSSRLQLLSGNKNPRSIIGANVIQMYVSEIAYFIEEAGATEEDILRLYHQGYDRIKTTVGNAHLAHLLLDTSANDADSAIEQQILKKIAYQKNTFFTWRSRWDARPKNFPIWYKTGETFKVITGNGSHPAQIITHESQLKGVPDDLVQEVPVDVREEYENALLTSIRDIGGRPTSSENKLIPEKQTIDRIFDHSHILTNIEGIIHVDSSEV
jgi:hypothetical protein